MLNEKNNEPEQAHPGPIDKDELIFVECYEKLGSVCQLLQPAVTFMKTAQWGSDEIRRNPEDLFGNVTAKTIIGQSWLKDCRVLPGHRPHPSGERG